MRVWTIKERSRRGRARLGVRSHIGGTMKPSHLICFGWICLASFQVAYGQAFENLDFEQAFIVSAPAGFTPFDATPPISAASALPSWTVREDGIVCNAIWGAPIALDETSVALVTQTNGVYPGFVPLQGSYSLQLYAFQGAPPPEFKTASISQTGLIPVTARSIQFLLESPPVAGGIIQANPIVTVDGTPLTLFRQSISGGIASMVADITGYAGSTVDLTFLCQGSPGGFPLSENIFALDDIQFSTRMVPEPSTLMSVGLFSALVAFHRRRPTSHNRS